MTSTNLAQCQYLWYRHNNCLSTIKHTIAVIYCKMYFNSVLLFFFYLPNRTAIRPIDCVFFNNFHTSSFLGFRFFFFFILISCNGLKWLLTSFRVRVTYLHIVSYFSFITIVIFYLFFIHFYYFDLHC